MFNGIYILKTSDGFRVKALPCAEPLFDGYNPDLIKYINVAELEKAFGDCDVFDYEVFAIKEANRIANNCDELVDGIRIIKDYMNYTFEELLNGKASKN